MATGNQQLQFDRARLQRRILMSGTIVVNRRHVRRNRVVRCAGGDAIAGSGCCSGLAAALPLRVLKNGNVFRRRPLVQLCRPWRNWTAENSKTISRLSLVERIERVRLPPLVPRTLIYPWSDLVVQNPSVHSSPVKCITES